MRYNSTTSITATASNWPLTGKDSTTCDTFLSLAAINFFGDFTRITALTNLNLPPLQLTSQYQQFLLHFLNQLQHY